MSRGNPGPGADRQLGAGEPAAVMREGQNWGGRLNVLPEDGHP